jgi:polyisoprenoid-binding protein YceI
MVLILLPMIGISGCANPADDVAPATTSEAKPIPPGSAAPGPAARAESASKPADPLEPSTGATAITPENTTIGFVGSKVTGSHNGGFKGATHTVTGNLTLHGVTKSISFPAKIAVSGDRATLDSEFFINRKDFGITYPGKANDLIRDEAVIKLAVHGPAK